ncbi:MAG: hypothetical protein JRH06_02585 [Deltaproteobacteria bacterium]|nr:hypothetical protein [Deltaproteobacteria bacterium]MBW2136426.1 hypothetical protein [Deltaproteobacteria bacterium]
MSKVMTMREAVSTFVTEGDTLFLSGAHAHHGEPSAAIHEIARQGIGHLTLICCLVATSGLLIVEGLLDRMITAFTSRDEKRSAAIRRAKSLGKLPHFEETSHFGRYGNVSDTAVGGYHHPVHRWNGSGGANDVMSFCNKVVIILKQSRRRFPEKVDPHKIFIDGRFTALTDSSTQASASQGRPSAPRSHRGSS